MQTTPESSSASGKGRALFLEPRTVVGPDLPQWHPYLNADRDFERTNLTLHRIQEARNKAASRLNRSGRDYAGELDVLFAKHITPLRTAAVINLSNFLLACERLIEDIDAL